MTYALVTVYFPQNDNVNKISKICAQADKTFILDNSPKENSKVFNKLSKSEYIFFGENCGLSKAFNNILKSDKYKFNDDDYIIFFDQDSKVEENHVATIKSEFENLKTSNIKIGAIGPFFFDTSSKSTTALPETLKINENSYSVQSIITSSMLTKYEILKDINFWNENVFLDMADWDLCWRLKARNYKICMAKSCIMQHALGNGVKNFGLIKVKQGKPFREYYQTRDCLYLLKERYVPLKYKIRFILMLTIRPLLHIIVLDEKKLRMSYIKKGFNDYKKSIHGELK